MNSRAIDLAVVALAWTALAGCASPRKPIFDTNSVRPAWPSLEKTPRVEWIGALSTNLDLKAPRKPFQALSDLFVGKASPVGLCGPRAVCVTPDGNRVWIADPGERSIHLFDLSQRRHAMIQRVGDSALMSPIAISQGEEGTIYLCDSQSVSIYELADTDGKLIRALRLPPDLIRPAGVYYDRTAKELYVVDVGAHDIKVIRPTGELVRILGKRGGAPGEFNYPSAILAEQGRLWIADTGNHRIQSITRSGDPIDCFGKAGDAPGDFAMPKAIGVDPDGHIYVVDGRFENVQVFDRTGQLLLYFGEEGHAPGQFWLPGGIFIEPTGRIWVCDAYNQRVQVFQYVKESPDVP